MKTTKGWVPWPELAMHYAVVAVGTVLVFGAVWIVVNFDRVVPSNSSEWAAWVQAIGSIAAIGIAIGVPYYQHSAVEHSKADDQARSIKDQRGRIVAAVRQEIVTSDEILQARVEAARSTLNVINLRERAGRPVTGPAMPASSFRITEAVIYRAAAAELGILPKPLLGAIIDYYSRVNEIERLAGLQTDARNFLKSALELIPRIRCTGAILRMELDKYEASGCIIETEEEFQIDQQAIFKAAVDVGYPLEEVAKQRGLDLKAAGFTVGN